MMPSLRELQQRFAAALLADDGVLAPLTCADAIIGAERLAIYRGTVRANYRNALGATFPVMHRLVGTPFFHAAVDAFVRAHPSRSGDLNIYGDAFGAFLATYPPASELPYLADVARLEWTIDEANRATDSAIAPDIVLGALAVLPAEHLPASRLRVEPSCRLLASRFPLLRIWQVNQPDHGGDLRVEFDAGFDHLRIRREPDGIAIERVAADDFAWLSALSRHVSLATAIQCAVDADAGFDLGTALHRYIGDGTIVGIVEHG